MGLNLHGMASGLISQVNPSIPASVQVSTGYAVGADGSPVPSYAAAVTVQAQVQPLSWRDLQQLDGLNLQGTRRAIYLYGRIDGIVRASSRGGDLITIARGPYAGAYLVALVLEQFPDWCKCACTLQNS